MVAFFTSLGFRVLNIDPSIFISQQREDITIVSVYVDNYLLISKHRKSLDWVKGELKREYNVKDLGEIKTIIGWQVI